MQQAVCSGMSQQQAAALHNLQLEHPLLLMFLSNNPKT
jgi:hypothetical protein